MNLFLMLFPDLALIAIGFVLSRKVDWSSDLWRGMGKLPCRPCRSGYPLSSEPAPMAASLLPTSGAGATDAPKPIIVIL